MSYWISKSLAEKKGLFPFPEGTPHHVSEDRIYISPQDLDRVLKKATPAPKKSSLLRKLSHAAKSVTQTTFGLYRVSEEQYNARIQACASCPGGHVEFRNGKPFSCGPLLGNKPKTCGCNIPSKARDMRENCPNGYWPPLNP